MTMGNAGRLPASEPPATPDPASEVPAPEDAPAVTPAAQPSADALREPGGGAVEAGRADPGPLEGVAADEAAAVAAELPDVEEAGVEPAGGDPSGDREEAVRAALERVLASPDLCTSPRLGAFLRYVVEATLAGRADQIKGYTIAVEALGRPHSFDPQADPIVRVEATRLRRALQNYYNTVGLTDPIQIHIPKGGYVPQFQDRSFQDRAFPDWPGAAVPLSPAPLSPGVFPPPNALPGAPAGALPPGGRRRFGAVGGARGGGGDP